MKIKNSYDKSILEKNRNKNSSMQIKISICVFLRTYSTCVLYVPGVIPTTTGSSLCN